MNGSSLGEGAAAAALASSSLALDATLSAVKTNGASTAAATSVAAAPMTDAAKASGRRWHAKVVLLSGLPARALFAEDAKSFQVRLGFARVTGVGGLLITVSESICARYILRCDVKNNGPHPQISRPSPTSKVFMQPAFH